MNDPNCLFCKMASGEIAVEMLHDDHMVFAIRDINPRAPVHLLIVPKDHIADGRHVGDAEAPVLGRMFAVAASLARDEGVAHSGYRLAFNVGEAAGMTVPHLHMHLLGGRQLGAEG